MVAVGQLVAGRYRIEAPLAKGGMGVVYRAIDERLARGVALKVLLQELASDTTEVTRFTREAAAVASLHHPGLVQVLDAGEDQGVPFLVMELVTGRTLSAILGSEGKLDPMRAADLVEQALFAISVAHGAGIIHRDLKPGNLMVVSTGGRELIKVLDFGIAQMKTGTAYTRLTQTGAIVGTPMFMAPEQVRGETCDARTDVYAMGAVLWSCLTGRKPFDSKDMADTVLKVMGEMPMRADRLEPRVPTALATAAEIALQKRREDRFASAGAFAAALADLRAAPRVSMAPPIAAPRTSLPSVAATSVLPSQPTAPPAAPTAATTPGISPTTMVAAIGALLTLVLVLFCVVSALVYRSFSGGESAATPVLAPAPRISGHTGGGNLGPGSGDQCDRAAACCVVLMTGLGDSSSCASIRTLSQYGAAAQQSCQQTYDLYSEQARQRGLRCE